ncbi:agglutinin biogenesis protein MshP [Duganella sp. Dugasp56]|uniref:pilus assembly PilX family protein n=1 Tax=Duganella sp. Dugasp56 TaxID=3243046 RepID=UPI0039AF1246
MKYRNLRRSAGVALVTAIFLLVVLAGLAVAVVSLTASQQNSSVQDVQGQRAYQSAKAGIEWALYTALQTPTGLGFCAAPVTFSMPTNTTLSAFTVTVTCSAAVPGYGDQANPANDPTANKRRIISTACNGPSGVACPASSPGAEYVQRVITAQL